jgi:carbon-monoxide dehydrogenase large subunit
MERMIDLVAGSLGLEPAEVRRRNMIRPDEMPYRAGIPYRDGEPIVYDSGDYPGALRQALAAVGGIEVFRQRQREARRSGRYLWPRHRLLCRRDRGRTVRRRDRQDRSFWQGVCFLRRLRARPGVETIFAQVVADTWAVAPEDVIVSLADTAGIPIGFGTIASRSTVTLSAAIHQASESLRQKAFAIAANLLECAPADLELRDGGVGVVGVPGAAVGLARLAQAARPGWDHGRPQGIQAGLEETHYWEPPTVTWSYAAHVGLVEVDAQTGQVKIDKYVVAHDCGVVVNPLLVEGQIAGGTAQGIGGILLEELAYDADGQLLTGSLMDYLLPTASDVPDLQMVHQHSPSPLNPLGVKGVGEGGAVAPPAAIANAICDALAPFGVEFNATPIKPEQIVQAVQAARPR